MQKYISRIIKSIKKFDLIDDGDVVVVGVSGGKDSMATAILLHEISKFYEKKFRIVAVSLDCTGGKAEKEGLFQKTRNFLEERGIEFKIIATDVFEIVFDIRKEKNPCSLCANLRRGKLNAAAKEIGATKIALGHHTDDLIETFFLSMLYEGRLNTFLPKTYFSRADITQIRPMIYIKESEIIAFCKKLDIPILDNCCGVNGKTQRQFIKDELSGMEKEVPGCKDRIFRAAMQWVDGKKDLNK